MKTKKIVSLVLAMVMVLSFSSVFVSATDECYFSNAISQTITGAPTMDGTVSVDEYGTPIIVTSQAHAAENDQITWTKQSSPENSDQKAKIYMTYDQTYLYIAATLDHAQENLRTDGAGGGYQPHLAVTASQKVGNGVFVSGSKEVYLFSRLAYKGTATGTMQDYFSRKYTATTYYDITGNVGKDYYVKYDSSTATYSYEMRIAWGNVPGMGTTYNGNAVAMTIELADGGAGASRNPSYYQIGGDAAQQGKFNSENPHGANVLTILPAGQFRVMNSVSPMPDVAPVADGTLTDGEYGDPMIITSQKHAATVTDDQINWTEKKTTPNSAQQAKIYMTNDAQYLYIAATLDNATKGLYDVLDGGAYHPHLAITASKLVGNGVLKDGGEKYLFSRVHLGAESTTAQIWSVDRPSGLNKGVSYGASYADGTYYFEMRIPWVNIPGMADSKGIYTGDDLAMTIELADGVADNTGAAGSYYTIGGTAACQGNWNTSAPHGDDVMAISCNVPYAEQTVVGTAGDLSSALTMAHPGDLIVLGDNMTVEEISLPSGVVLDLNGKTLTVTKFIAHGDVVDKTQGTGGIAVVGNETFFSLQESNSMIALFDEDFGYRFFSYMLEYKTIETGDEDSVKFAIRLDLPTADAYALLDNDANYDTFFIKLNLSNSEGACPPIDYVFKRDTMKTYVERSSVDVTKKYGITLTVYGMNSLEAKDYTLNGAEACVSFANVTLQNAYN